ncbi:MAG: antitoxin family protein [Deltaproteobacteria bacterium]|jgi:predicted DNA-binding antitoxin AbrB/MazE fold protein|nr:antitoxin family protein [Deltaproteobacteria bacterium]
MTKTLHALYDGKVLRPEEPLNLKPNIRVLITVEMAVVEKPKRPSFLQTARSLQLEGPSDWSARIEDYLYGEANHACK